MNETNKESIVTKDVQVVNNSQANYPTWGLLIFLIGFFVVLKMFIYIKDPKRDGKIGRAHV